MPEQKKQRLAVIPVPMDLAWQDPTENLRRMRQAIQSVRDSHPEIPGEELLFVFPELCLTGFVTEAPVDFALMRDSRPVVDVCELSRTFSVAIVFGFPELITTEGRKEVQNTLMLAGPDGRILADYQKMNLFTQGKTPESATYRAGRAPRIVEYRGWKLGFGICFDLRFPELFIEYRKKGCDLLLLPACWIGGPAKSEQFQTLARAQAIFTQSFFVALNRTGIDPFSQYEGEALVYGPKGEVLLAVQNQIQVVFLEENLLSESRKIKIRKEFQ